MRKYAHVSPHADSHAGSQRLFEVVSFFLYPDGLGVHSFSPSLVLFGRVSGSQVGTQGDPFFLHGGKNFRGVAISVLDRRHAGLNSPSLTCCLSGTRNHATAPSADHFNTLSQ